MEPRLVIFDIDGTLVDSQAQILASMQLAFDALGRPMPPRQTALAVVGLSLPEAMARLAPDLPAERIGALVEGYRQGYFRERNATPAALYPGAEALLAQLAATPEVILGIATGKSRRGVDHLIAAQGWGRYFLTIQTADDHPSKPHPSMVEAALRETGIPAERAVMVGDTDYDIAMGRAAGVGTIGVDWGYHGAARLARAKADRVVSDFEGLRAALTTLPAAGKA